MKEKSIRKNVILSTMYQILIMIIPFITAPYISRIIGAEGVGIYSFTLSIETYFSMFAALGTLSYGTREIARVRNDEEKRSKLFWEIELLTIFTSIICIILWFIFIGISKSYKVYYLILTLNLLNVLFDISWFYAGLEEFKYTIIKNSIFKIIGVILLFIFIKSPNDLWKYILIMSSTTLLGTMTMWMYLPRFIKKVKVKELKIFPHFKETLVYFIPTIATSIYTVLDKTLIGTITKDAYENGYYEQATKITNMLKALTFTSLNSVLGSRISYLFVNNKIEEIKIRIKKSMDYIFFMGFGLMFGLIGVANNFVPLFFGEGYDKVIILLKMMSPLIVIIGISNFLGSQYYTPAGLRKKSAMFIIIGSIVNLTLNLILIPKFMSYGATIATIIAETTISVLYLINCNGFFKLIDIIKLNWKKILSGLLMLIAIYMIGFLNLSNIIILCLQIIIGGLLYLILLILLRDQFILEFINKFINKVEKVRE